MNDEALDEKFKDADDPLRLVFVCAMWLTGFDAPSCSTIYLDKPMRNHTLMQTIARANRVFPGKHSGLIVDYANVFASLEKALAIYGKGKGGGTPVRDKRSWWRICGGRWMRPWLLPGPRRRPRRHRGVAHRHLSRLTALADAVDRLISPDPLRKDFLAHERLVHALYQAVKPDPVVAEFSARVACLAVIGAEIRERTNPDRRHLGGDGGDQRCSTRRSRPTASGFRRSGNGLALDGVIDISAIDFEALAKRFAKTPAEERRARASQAGGSGAAGEDGSGEPDARGLPGQVRGADRVVQRRQPEHRRPVQGAARPDAALTDEQQRHVREQLTEEELTVFDLLTGRGRI